MSSRTGSEARRARGTQATAGSRCKLGGPGRRRGPQRRPLPPSPQPGLARRPSPWKPEVDSAVNMNFPSSRQPRRRRLPAPRPGSARLGLGGRVPHVPRRAPCAREPGDAGYPVPPATRENPAQSRARHLRPAPVGPLQESPGRRRGQGLKEPQPASTAEWVRAG